MEVDLFYFSKPVVVWNSYWIKKKNEFERMSQKNLLYVAETLGLSSSPSHLRVIQMEN